MSSRNDVRRILDDLGVYPRKKLGQNFLLNEGVAAKTAEVAASKSALEIGPGLGVLTVRLAFTCDSLTCVEVSERLAAYLRALPTLSATTVLEADFLELDPRELPGYPFDCLVGNLPYSISSPVLLRLLEQRLGSVKKAVFMLQREVAQRVRASGGGKSFGRLHLQIWPFFEAEKILDVGPDDFYPRPAVSSRVLLLKRRERALLDPSLLEDYRRVVKASFASRRKTILNNLARLVGKNSARVLLGKAGIEPGCRAEELSPECFLRLTEEVSG
ncbi:ribosomal RNA small subunit methyltransferase A [Candidatus Fermentibacteria bacterium]|nr:ribosomal RNA small subunit methyltransferase A [Candidatus Fermentibacteria bacterium]